MQFSFLFYNLYSPTPSTAHLRPPCPFITPSTPCYSPLQLYCFGVAGMAVVVRVIHWYNDHGSNVQCQPMVIDWPLHVSWGLESPRLDEDWVNLPHWNKERKGHTPATHRPHWNRQRKERKNTHSSTLEQRKKRTLIDPHWNRDRKEHSLIRTGTEKEHSLIRTVIEKEKNTHWSTLEQRNKRTLTGPNRKRERKEHTLIHTGTEKEREKKREKKTH